MVTAGAQPHIGKVVLGACRDRTDLQCEDQQHEHCQPRGRAQSGKQGAGGSRNHPRTIHTYPGVMEFHLELLGALAWVC